MFQCKFGDMLVRDATFSDLPQILRIYNQSIPSRRSVGDVMPVSISDRTSWFNSFELTGMPIWVLTDGEFVIAWVCVAKFNSVQTFDHTGQSSLFVESNHQRRGLGKALKRLLLDRCQDYGIEIVLTTCFSHNIPAIELNKQLGMKEWGRLYNVASIEDIYYDLVTLGIDLKTRLVTP